MANVVVGRVLGTGGADAVNSIVTDDNTRKYVIITNNIAQETYLALGTNALVGSGILLSGKGSSYEVDRTNYVTTKITAAGSGGDIDLCYQTR